MTVPAGTYMISSSVRQPQNTTLRGLGYTYSLTAPDYKGAKVMCAPGMTGPLLLMQDATPSHYIYGLTVEGISFDGNSANTSCTAIYANYVANSFIRNNDIKNFSAGGIVIDKADPLMISQNSLSYISGGMGTYAHAELTAVGAIYLSIIDNELTGTTGDDDNMYLLQVGRSRIIGNNFEHGNRAMVMVGVQGAMRVIGNTFNRARQHGVILTSTGAINTTDVQFVGNTFDNNGSSASNTYYGLYLNGAQNITLTGNAFTNADSPNYQAYGIYGALNTDTIFLSGDTFYGNLTGSISFPGTAHGDYWDNGTPVNLDSPTILYSHLFSGLSAALPQTTLYTPATAGLFGVDWHCWTTTATGSGTLSPTEYWNNGTFSDSSTPGGTLDMGSATSHARYRDVIYSGAGQAISFATIGTPTGTYAYTCSVVVSRVQ